MNDGPPLSTLFQLTEKRPTFKLYGEDDDDTI